MSDCLMFHKTLQVTTKRVYRQHGRGRYQLDYKNYAGKNPNAEVILCNAIIGRPYTGLESDALIDKFLELQRPLTNEEVQLVLFTVALGGWEEEIPF